MSAISYPPKLLGRSNLTAAAHLTLRANRTLRCGRGGARASVGTSFSPDTHPGFVPYLMGRTVS